MPSSISPAGERRRVLLQLVDDRQQRSRIGPPVLDRRRARRPAPLEPGPDLLVPGSRGWALDPDLHERLAQAAARLPGARGAPRSRPVGVALHRARSDGSRSWTSASRRRSSAATESTRKGMSSLTISTTECGDSQPCSSTPRGVDADLGRAGRPLLRRAPRGRGPRRPGCRARRRACRPAAHGHRTGGRTSAPPRPAVPRKLPRQLGGLVDQLRLLSSSVVSMMAPRDLSRSDGEEVYRGEGGLERLLSSIRAVNARISAQSRANTASLSSTTFSTANWSRSSGHTPEETPVSEVACKRTGLVEVDEVHRPVQEIGQAGPAWHKRSPAEAPRPSSCPMGPTDFPAGPCFWPHRAAGFPRGAIECRRGAMTLPHGSIARRHGASELPASDARPSPRRRLRQGGGRSWDRHGSICALCRRQAYPRSAGGSRLVSRETAAYGPVDVES